MIFLRETDAFDISVRGIVKMDNEGNYNIYIHRDLSDEAKRKTIKHEMNHIGMGHLLAEDCVRYLELQADGRI